jgi:protein subunit release factor A
MPEWRRGRRYMEQKLLELSAVPVPANPNALMMAKSAGIETDEVEKMLVAKDFEIDRENRIVKVYQDEDVFAVTFEFINSLDPEAIKEFTEWKSGATLSAKSKKELNEIHEIITKCSDRFRKFIDAAGMMEDEPPEGMPMTATRTAEITEIKQALEDIKSQVLLLSPKPDASKDINLDAIKITLKNEPEIEPETLQRLIKESIENVINQSIQNKLGN